MENHLPPLVEKYGDRLEIAEIETSNDANYKAYQAAIKKFDVPRQRQGVPAIFIADTHLVGSLEIGQKLEGLIEKHLEQGGIAYPDIEGLDAILASQSGS
jgi:hypothetical protein